MTLGGIARSMLGRYFSTVATWYRSIFVDVHAIAEHLAGHLPRNPRCLDVGGGDGVIADSLLRLRPDLTITIIDLSPIVGKAISKEVRNRASILPSTSMDQFMEISGTEHFDAIIVSDVLHHVALKDRQSFFSDLYRLAKTVNSKLILFKDVQPGYFRSTLSYLSDYYVSGDRNVSLLSISDLRSTIDILFDGSATINQAMPDPPNYCLVVKIG